MNLSSGQTFWVVSCPGNSLFYDLEREYFYTYEQALAAAGRLAADFPGTVFLVLQAISASYVRLPKPTTYMLADDREESLRRQMAGLMPQRARAEQSAEAEWSAPARAEAEMRKADARRKAQTDAESEQAEAERAGSERAEPELAGSERAGAGRARSERAEAGRMGAVNAAQSADDEAEKNAKAFVRLV